MHDKPVGILVITILLLSQIIPMLLACFKFAKLSHHFQHFLLEDRIICKIFKASTLPFLPFIKTGICWEQLFIKSICIFCNFFTRHFSIPRGLRLMAFIRLIKMTEIFFHIINRHPQGCHKEGFAYIVMLSLFRILLLKYQLTFLIKLFSATIP